MEHQRPRGREKHVTGPGKTVQKRGEGLGTGPVGEPGGSGTPGGQREPAAPARSAPTRSGGGMKLIALLLMLALGGGGGLTALFGGQSSGGQSLPANQPQTSQTQGGQQQSSISLAELLGGLGGGSVSSGWQGEANTGRLDTTVAPGARKKYTKLLGGGKDTATILVYMCGTDLESRSGMGTADLQEMLGARFGDKINLLVYTGGCSRWQNNQVSSSKNQIWQVKDGQLLNLQKDLGSVSMTDPDTLSGYIRWGVKNYPASRYQLILWDHGGGSVSGYGYDEKFASSGSMSLAGVDAALRDAGVKFDFIGFDACLMATAETALTLTQYADYLIASEETEPGVGWYYTDWLTAFGADSSQPTIQLGEKIVDSFVDTCAQKCPGQLTTLSVIDLAELEATLPQTLADFSRSASRLIQNKEYQTVSSARSGAREFAKSSRIDQVDLVHLARNLGTQEGEALAEALLGAVKYNRTSSNMSNAYGISIYFPYQKTSTVDKAVSTYQQIGMDEDYARCIQQFASLEASGQAVSGGSSSPLPTLLGTLGGSEAGGQLIGSLLESFLGGDVSSIAGLTGGNTGFLSNKALSQEETAQYLAENRFAPEDLVWQDGAQGMALYNVYDFDEKGGLLAPEENSWVAVEGQPVAYYHTATLDDGVNYTITGRVPVLYNGVRGELLLVFDNANPRGTVVGLQTVYAAGETDTVAKNQISLQPGDTLVFLCDYYSYTGEYQDSFLLGEPVTVPAEGLAISDVLLEGSVRATYRFTDLYNQHYWSPVIPEK